MFDLIDQCIALPRASNAVKTALIKPRQPPNRSPTNQMLPLSCARERAHTGRKTRAHKKTWSSHKSIFSRNVSHIHVIVQKRLWTNNFLCSPYFIVVVVNVYRSRDFTRSRSLQTFTKSYFCIKLSECILYNYFIYNLRNAYK